jgi:Pregnancy-associated plasma protein-A
LLLEDEDSQLSSFLSIDLAGFATFPEWAEEWPVNDGVVLNYGVVPGGYISYLNQGFTLAHEVGHWLGLYHTFDVS